MSPWGDRPRHRVWWASDTFWTFLAAVVVIAVYIVWEIVDTAPQGMVTLVGLAGGAVFGAATGDKRKRDADVSNTADRAETKADRANDKADALTRVAEREHPEDAEAEKPPLTDPKGGGDDE
ncbi:hypothetical protein ACQ856_18040 [Mycolicibacterium psychrotolerans]|uniref:hypothetical protein n=1 Tax=Mycolicibacterium psychrotolerans TaxID=216929 RepID=UPI003D66A045